MRIPTVQAGSLDQDKLAMQKQLEQMFLQAKAQTVRANAARSIRPIFGKRPSSPGRLESLLLRISRRRRRLRMRDIMLESGLFDVGWYLRRYPDVAAAGINPADHYLYHGAGELRDPGPDFSTASYLSMYPDVRAADVNPLLHYLRFGYDEMRLIQPSSLPQD